MFGIKELKNEIADINRKLERILWILSDKPPSIEDAYIKQFESEVDQAYKRRNKSVVKYKKLKTSFKTIDRLVSVLSERPYSVKQLSIKLNLTENSVRTYMRDARVVGHKIDRITKRRNGKLVSYYTMEV